MLTRSRIFAKRLFSCCCSSSVYPDLKNAMEQWEQTLLQDLTEDEQQQLNSLLAKIRERVNKEA